MTFMHRGVARGGGGGGGNCLPFFPEKVNACKASYKNNNSTKKWFIV